MRQALQLKIGQSLTMTPQLQQAIRLLQLSTLELQQEIQTAIENNMMLEASDETPTKTELEEPNKEEPDKSTEQHESLNERLPEELSIDASWDDIYDSTTSVGLPQTTDTPRPDPGDINAPQESLHELLFWQMELTNFSDKDRVIATAIIDEINDEGYLKASPEDINKHLTHHLDDLELDEIIAVLHKIQSFDPPGIGASNLQECILIQLKQLPPKTPFLAEAVELITEQMDALSTQDIAKLKRQLTLNEHELRQTLTLIKSLNPQPGSSIQHRRTNYITPDVYVQKTKSGWRVSLNGHAVKTLRINPYYETLMKRGDKSADGQMMKEHLQEAQWFLKSLQNRNETLLRVAQQIVERQSDFLTHGAIAMKPLVLRDIAEAVDLHESTISRVTTQKYIHTPNGIFELKHFFSSHVSTDTGGECSATAIRVIIKELINNENSKKPLSDNKITAILGDKGINVARRTIAKYRKSMSIPPSSQRKHLL